MSSKMTAFAKIPSRWLVEGGLKGINGTPGGRMLKAYFAACVLRGQFDAQRGGPQTDFPLHLDQFRGTAGLSRTDAKEALDKLCAQNILQRSATPARALRVHQKAGIYTFVGQGPSGWMPFPWKRIDESDLLHRIRASSTAGRTALKIFLVLVALRNNTSGSTSIGYEKLAEKTGATRTNIRSGLDFLFDERLVHTLPQHEQHEPTSYFVMGLVRPPPANSLGGPDFAQEQP